MQAFAKMPLYVFLMKLLSDWKTVNGVRGGVTVSLEERGRRLEECWKAGGRLVATSANAAKTS